MTTNLLVDDSAKSCLALDNSIRHTKLAAERRQEDDQLNRIDIVGNQDQGGFLVLNQADNVVETILDSVGLLADILLLATILDGGGLFDQSLLLLCKAELVHSLIAKNSSEILKYAETNAGLNNRMATFVLGECNRILESHRSLTSLSLRPVLVEEFEKLYYHKSITFS